MKQFIAYLIVAWAIVWYGMRIDHPTICFFLALIVGAIWMLVASTRNAAALDTDIRQILSQGDAELWHTYQDIVDNVFALRELRQNNKRKASVGPSYTPTIISIFTTIDLMVDEGVLERKDGANPSVNPLYRLRASERAAPDA